MIVVDASVLAPALGDDGAAGTVARARLVGETLAAPELIDLEVSSVLRGRVLAGKLDAVAAEVALGDLVALPIRLTSHRALITRCWQLRHNLTSYDAAYVALAEILDVPLVTADANLQAVPGIRCVVETLTIGQ